MASITPKILEEKLIAQELCLLYRLASNGCATQKEQALKIFKIFAERILGNPSNERQEIQLCERCLICKQPVLADSIRFAGLLTLFNSHKFMIHQDCISSHFPRHEILCGQFLPALKEDYFS